MATQYLQLAERAASMTAFGAAADRRLLAECSRMLLRRARHFHRLYMAACGAEGQHAIVHRFMQQALAVVDIAIDDAG